MIFSQKLANLYDVVCPINLFSVRIDKTKLESGDTPLKTYHWSFLNCKISKKFKKFANEPKMAVIMMPLSKSADVIKF